MGKLIDMTGREFEECVVIKRSDKLSKDGKKIFWECECKCGNTFTARGSDIRSGNTKSCGCLVKKKARTRKGAHGQRNSRIYTIWNNMKLRCYNKNQNNYFNYGGRGIKICDEWKNDFTTFYNWAIENGYSDELSIERINNDGDYEPSNCKWANLHEQARNKRNNRFLEHDGKKMIAPDWSKVTGIPEKIIYDRMTKGWDDERVLTQPIGKSTKSKERGLID